MILLTALGSERHSADFGSEETSEAADVAPERNGSGRFTRDPARVRSGSRSG